MDQAESVVHQVKEVQPDEIESEVGQAFRQPFREFVRVREQRAAHHIDSIEADASGIVDKMLAFNAGETMFPGRGIEQAGEVRGALGHFVRNIEGEKTLVGRDNPDFRGLLRPAPSADGQRGKGQEQCFFHSDSRFIIN